MRVKVYRRGHSPQAHHVLDIANYYRLAAHHQFETLEFWHRTAQVEAGLLIAPGCEPATDPARPASPASDHDYLTNAMLRASGLGV